MKYIGGIFRPGSEFATPPAELAKLPGFGKNIEAARAEAKRLLKEAGVPDGFSFVLKNRNVKEPYEVSGVFVVDQWRKIGLNVTHTPLEGGPYFNDLRQGNFDAGIDFDCEFMDEPDLYLLKYLSSDKSPVNYARYKDADARRALRAAEPHARSERSFADHSPDGKARHRRPGVPVPASLVAAGRAAQQPAQGLEDRSEPLRQPGSARRVAGAVKKLKRQK